MGMYGAVFLALALMLGLLLDLDDQAARSSESTDLSVLAHSLLVYRNALAEYAVAHPGVTGAVADSALNLPTWYVKASGVQGYIAAGRSYTYCSDPPRGLATQLGELTGRSLAVGSVSGGQLVNPFAGQVGVSVPTAIPQGSVVLYQ